MAHSNENPRWAPLLAAGVALAVYAFTASGHGYWLDSGEFSAAAVQLDIAHPPGHPLASLWGKLFSLLPVGPLPYRVAIGQAFAAALALGFVQVAIARTLRRIARPDRSLGGAASASVLLSLAATWMLAGAYGFWFQAVRAEVYALEALLVCCALERISALACSDFVGDPRALYCACLALGFGLANHHFIAVLALPALAWELLRLVRTHGLRVFAGGLLSGSIGLLTYVYLPMRALTEPPMDLGHPVTLRDFSWVVSARVYARNIGSQALQPLDERFADLAVLLVENLTAPLLLLAVLGAYALLRSVATRAVAYLWLSTALISLCGRAYLNPVRANPDVLGYMMPGFAAVVALAAAGVAALLVLVPAGRLSTMATRIVCAGLTVCSLSQFARESARASLRDFAATEPFDDLRVRNLPTRALVVLTSPESIFRHWEGQAVEQLRPDVTMVPVPFLGYGATHEVLLRREPQLRTLVDGYLARGELSLNALRELARKRPVLIELDARVALRLFAGVLPEALLYRIADVDSDSLARAAGARSDLRSELNRRLSDQVSEPETRKQLLWIDYVAALQLAQLGQLALARAATDSALSLSPKTRELVLLREALDRALAHSPATLQRLNIEPFLPGSERSF